MIRRPLIMLLLLILGAAFVQGAIIAVSPSDPATSQDADNGLVCTACGPIRKCSPHAPREDFASRLRP
jgi:hypothetical protein